MIRLVRFGAFVVLWLSPLLAWGCPAQADDLLVGAFSRDGLEHWKRHSFEGETSYRPVLRDGRRVIRAESRGTASALYREMRVDLEKTPFLNWSWRVDNIIPGVDERTRPGDDYPARIYVVVREGLFPWQTKAVNYVWSSSLPRETRWLSAFTDSSLMIAARSGAGELNTRVREKRNVREDLERFLGREVRYIDVVALMSDTDSGSSAGAEYGDICFSSE